MARSLSEMAEDAARLELTGGGPVSFGDRCTIGRHPGNALVLDDVKASRWHAAVVRLTDGRYRVMDLNTKNGTYLNGERVSDPVSLKDGDVIRIGAINIAFRAMDPSTQTGHHLQSTVEDTAFLLPLRVANMVTVTQGAMVLGADGVPEAITETVRHCLERFWPDHSRSGLDLPRELATWIEEQMRPDEAGMEMGSARSPFRRQRGERVLTGNLSMTPDRTKVFVMLVEEEPLYTEESLRQEMAREFGATTRECEILFYVIQGKTNPEIGTILGIAERTVKKHLENAFPKLGIENRQSAGAFVEDYFRRRHAEAR